MRGWLSAVREAVMSGSGGIPSSSASSSADADTGAGVDVSAGVCMRRGGVRMICSRGAGRRMYGSEDEEGV